MEDATRRRLLLGAMGAVFGVASCRRALGARIAAEERAVADFDQVHWDASGELSVEQSGREQLLLEAEPAVLRKIVVRVRERRLEIAFAPGGIETTEPISFRLQVKALRSLELHGSGDARIGALQTPALALALHGSSNLQLERLTARTFELRLAGSSDVRIGGGQVESQRIAIRGAGDVHAAALASRRAEVSIDGGGRVELAAADVLDARIGGAGDIRYRGNPRVTQTIHGAGSVSRDG